LWAASERKKKKIARTREKQRAKRGKINRRKKREGWKYARRGENAASSWFTVYWK